jgi:hypothetical protein
MAHPTVARVAMLAKFAVWEQQVADGHLTLPGLQAVRISLLHDREFPACRERDHMLVVVGDALAAKLGVPAELLTGSPLVVPDDVAGLAGLEDPPRRDW